MTRVMTWRDADGTSTVFDGTNGILLRADPLGLEAPNPTNTISDYISFDGAALSNRRRSIRQIALPFFVEHPTRVETKIAELASILQGPGELEWSDDVNTRYLRNVIYDTGIDGSGISNLGERVLVVSLVALDPWWYGVEQDQALSVASPTAFDAAIGFDAVIPFDGGASAIVPVDGDADASPVVTVNGPVTTLTVGTGGLEWSIAAPLAAGAVLVVDSNPGNRGPRLNGGAIDWSLLTEASRLWTLAPGATSVISGSTGSTGGSSISMAWASRHLTP